MPQVAQGGTVRLLATFEDSTGALTDPTTPVVDILNPSNTVVVNDAALVRDSLGEYHYDFTADVAAPLGAWTARFTGTINGAPITGDEAFTVLPQGSVGVGEPWLVQLADVRRFLGVSNPSDTRKDPLYINAIAAASRAIINFTERDFASPLVTEARAFEYDGSGYLDVDDCTAVQAVEIVVPNSDNIVVDAQTWAPMPVRRKDAPVYYYVIMPQVSAWGISPQMGFTRNLDRWAAEHGIPNVPQMVNVTATWGWPDVPADVQQAALWTISAWVDNPKASENLQSESIAGFSRSWASMASALQALAIPNRARDLLSNYDRVRV